MFRCCSEDFHSESTIKRHLQIKHFRYFPFSCNICEQSGKIYPAATQDDMEKHTTESHPGSEPSANMSIKRCIEAEIQLDIEKCWLTNSQIPSNDLDSNEDEHNSDLIEIMTDIEISEPGEHSVVHPIINFETKPSVNISVVPEPNNFTESYVELDLPGQSSLDRKRQLPDNANDLPESTEKRRMTSMLVNDKQLGSSAHCSREVNRDHANGSSQNVKVAHECNIMNATISHENDGIERPTTSAQFTSNIAADFSQSASMHITKLFIVISEGIVCFETTDGCKHDYAPLSEYFPTLRKAVIYKEYEVAIQFYATDVAIPSKYRKITTDQGSSVKEFDSLAHLKKFAEQMRLIAVLWKDIKITAYFGRFKTEGHKTLSQSEYCTELFGDQSVLKCKGLYVIVVDNWPLSILKNVFERCGECELHIKEEARGNRQMQDAFLEELYDGEALQRIEDITLSIYFNAGVKDFIHKLKERYINAPHKRFEFTLSSYSDEFHGLSLLSPGEDHVLEAKTYACAHFLELIPAHSFPSLPADIFSAYEYRNENGSRPFESTEPKSDASRKDSSRKKEQRIVLLPFHMLGKAAGALSGANYFTDSRRLFAAQQVTI
ncbi:hypothetical protein Ddc_13824 [Ditylenchus destructor]|nr:hypothetical protein Ddc_13824 [Ditylenchus destructor]